MSKTMLVADDSLTIRKVIALVFSTDDIQITAVDNGVDAISRARELRPDILLADVTMPGKSGYEVCRDRQGRPVDARHSGHPPGRQLLEPFDEGRARSVGASGLRHQALRQRYADRQGEEAHRARLGRQSAAPLLPRGSARNSRWDAPAWPSARAGAQGGSQAPRPRDASAHAGTGRAFRGHRVRECRRLGGFAPPGMMRPPGAPGGLSRGCRARCSLEWERPGMPGAPMHAWRPQPHGAASAHGDACPRAGDGPSSWSYGAR